METIPLVAAREDSESLLALLVKFLASTGNVLLVQGTPGAGKTTLAFELLRRMEGPRIGEHTLAPNRLYVSSRASPVKLRKHFPWINEVIDSGSGRQTNVGTTEFANEFHVSQADNILSRVLNLKASRQKSIIVIDSWEGALRNTTEEGRRMLESAVLSQPDESRVSVVLVSETEGSNNLAHLVDGVVTLTAGQLEGRRLRTLAVNKLRGFRIQNSQGPFTLDKGRFTLLPETEHESTPQYKVKIPEPIRHKEHSYSTGSADFDKMLKGGIRKGSSLLFDLDNSVSPLEMRLLLRIICSNFVNQGGASIIVPSSTISSENVAHALSKCIGEKALRERVRIAEFNPTLPEAPWRLAVTGKLQEDLHTFTRCWKELTTVSPRVVLASDFDKIVQVYGEDLFLPNLSAMGANIRDSEALNIGMASRPTKLREDFLRTADYHLKLQNVGGVLVMYGVKPFTNIHGVEFSLQKGFPSVSLSEIV